MASFSWLVGEDFAAQWKAWADGTALWASGGRYLPHGLPQMAITPTSQAQEGELQRFSGELEFLDEMEPLRAPLTGRRCVYYELTVERWEGERRALGFGDGSQRGKKMHLFDWGAQDFYLVDESGRARVHQQRPAVIMEIDRKLEPKISKEVPAELRTLLDRLGREKANKVPQFKGTKLLVREGVLEPGEQLNIWAMPRWKVGGDEQGYRDASRALWLEGGEDTEATFLITDRLKRKK